MIIDARALEILINLSNHDIRDGYAHSSESFAKTLQKYIHEYTSGLEIHVPENAPFGYNPSKFYKKVIRELNLIRGK